MAWNDKRPMSPHLQVYNLPLTARLSIFHRATGAVLFFGLLLTVWVLMAAAAGGDSWQNMHGFLAGWFGKLVLFGFSFAMYYHFCNGIRHLVWDTGKGLGKQESHTSAIMVIIASVVLTLITWIVA